MKMLSLHRWDYRTPLLILILLIGMMGPVLAHAQTPTTDPSPTTETPAPTSVTVTMPASEYREQGGCGPLQFGCQLLKLPGLLLSGIALLFLVLSGAILTLAGTVFNWVVIRTVFQFGTYFGTSDGMLVAWGIMRDISNIGLLFGFIFMGVMLILNVEGGGHGHGGGISAKRAIPRLIIFAVLLNFSLFASQAVIDVANAFSSSFATLAGEQCSTTTTTSTDPTGGQSLRDCVNVGIAGQIMAAAGMTKLFSLDAFSAMGDGFSNIQTQPYQYTLSLIMLSVFVLITAVVLLAGAIMLIIRVVILSLLMVTSPIGFAGMVIPGLSGLASRWWKTLISQSFFAPVYLLLIFISIKLTEGLMQGDATLADAIIANSGNSVAGNMQVVMVFLIVIGFMIASLIAATKMGAMGASFATNSASALVFGAAARGTNYVAGGGARALRVAQQRTGIGGRAGQVAVNRMLRPIENANLDARAVVPFLKTGLGAAGISAGAKPAEHATYADMAHQFSDIKNRETGKKLQKQYENERALGSLDGLHGKTPSQQQQDSIKTLGVGDLKKLHDVAGIAGYLSSDQFDAYMKDKDVTDDKKAKVKASRVADLAKKAPTMTADAFENATKVSHFNAADKEVLKTARYGELAGAIAANDQASINAIAKNVAKKDLETIPSALLTDQRFLDALSDRQRDDIVASNARTAAEKNAVRGSYVYAKINAEFNAAGGGEPAAAAAASRIGSLDPSAAAKLDARILTNPQAAGALTPAVLVKLQDEKLTLEERRTIGKNIRNNAISMGNPQIKAFMEGPAGAMW